MSDICVAILAKNQAASLPTYLTCLLNQTFPKSKTHLYIRSNDNTDQTEAILRQFVELHGSKYGSVFTNYESINPELKKHTNHDWNAFRFKILGKIRQDSVDYARDHGYHYIVIDCDNFIRSHVLEMLYNLRHLGVIAPMLPHLPTNFYANYHADVDPNGYYKSAPIYQQVLYRQVKGIIEMPVVHCTYFIEHSILKDIVYDDESYRYEYVIFSHNLRKKKIPQYIDNRMNHGFLTFAETADKLAEEWRQYRSQEDIVFMASLAN